MMQRVLTKYGLVFHTALILVFPLLLLVRSQVSDLVPLLWLALVALEMMVLLPAVRKGETLADARQRVVRELVWDPFLYAGAAVVAVALIQWANSGCRLVYLSDADVWQFSSPALAWAPFSVEPSAAFSSLSLLAACLAVGLVLRNAVSKGAKRLLLQGICEVSGIVALWSVWQATRGVEPYASLALAKGSAPMGTFFGFWLLLGMGSFIEAVSRFQKGLFFLFVLGVAGNLLGMLFFASALALPVYAGFAVVLFVYWIPYLAPLVPKQIQLKLFLGSVAVIAVVAIWLVFVYHGNPVGMKIKAAIPAEAYWGSLSESKSVRTTAALGVWQDHPWMGVGADGFRHFSGLTVAGKAWGLMKTDPACVLNDSLQFLCEFGVLGCGLILAAVITLMVPICYRARLAWKFGTQDENEGRLFLFRISPIVLCGVLSTFLCFLESWVASPFRSPYLLLSWVCVMAALPAFLPSRAPTGKV